MIAIISVRPLDVLKSHSWTAEFFLWTGLRTLWLFATRFRGVGRLLAQCPCLIRDTLLCADRGPARNERPDKSIRQRHRSEAWTIQQAELVQFLVERHAADPEIGCGAKAVVAIALQGHGDLLALDRLLRFS
jgi:hypothetical protein